MGSSTLWGKIIVLVVVCGWALSAQAKYAGGSGTEAEPFRISAVSDWQELMTSPVDWESHFVLTDDLDLDGVLLSPVGDDANNFTGVLDGNDCVIRNADVNMPGTDYVGLFGYLGTDGQIKNLGVEDAAIFGQNYVAGLVGRNYGTIANCYSTGSVSGDQGIGGLVGGNDWHGTIANCYSTGSVSGTGESVGGLVGYNRAGGISNSYAGGSVTGTNRLGGLVGRNGYDELSCVWICDEWGWCREECSLVSGSGWIYKCYSTGKVSGGSGVGGLVGLHVRGEVGDSFWDIET